jgi:hypothetical protein
MVIPPAAGFHCRRTVGNGSDEYRSVILFLKETVFSVYLFTLNVFITPLCWQVYLAFE